MPPGASLTAAAPGVVPGTAYRGKVSNNGRDTGGARIAGGPSLASYPHAATGVVSRGVPATGMAV